MWICHTANITIVVGAVFFNDKKVLKCVRQENYKNIKNDRIWYTAGRNVLSLI